jgi:hypothetical protein
VSGPSRRQRTQLGLTFTRRQSARLRRAAGSSLLLEAGQAVPYHGPCPPRSEMRAEAPSKLEEGPFERSPDSSGIAIGALRDGNDLAERDWTCGSGNDLVVPQLEPEL